jgi:hypothetical protein
MADMTIVGAVRGVESVSQIAVLVQLIAAITVMPPGFTHPQ